MQLNQDCADVLAQNAAKRLGYKLQFHYPEGKVVHDKQIDIQAAMIGAEGIEIRSSEAGFSEDAFLTMLKELDCKKMYAVRTGTNNGPGHYRLMYFEAGRWVSYSSETNYRNITDQTTGKLTQDGIGEFIIPNQASWGKSVGQYSFLVIPMTMDVIIRVANYVYTYRLEDEEAANLQAFTADQSIFREGITATKIEATRRTQNYSAASIASASQTLFGKPSSQGYQTLPPLPPRGMSKEAYETFKQLYEATPDILTEIADTIPTLIRETTTKRERAIMINGVSINHLLHDKCGDKIKALLEGLLGSSPT